MQLSSNKHKTPARSPLRLAAANSLAAVVAAGVQKYDRNLHLARLLPLMPKDLADNSVAGQRRIVARLARALRAERNRGRAGHWTYDLNRHIALTQAYAAERQALERRNPTLRNAGSVTRLTKRKPPPAKRRRSEALWQALFSGGGVAGQGPSSSPELSERRRNSAPPSDSRRAGPTCPDIPPAKDRNAS